MDDKPSSVKGTTTQARSRSYDNDVLESCRALRQEKRARTHARIAKVPNKAMTAIAVSVGLLSTVASAAVWGSSAAITLQIGAVMAAVYSATNDVRISIARKNPDWRRRHPVVARIFPRHPLDRD
ncbi:hypothetical protein [Streptomyces sp. NPDC015414]|uniref:hypothetical protein n=1 Tax=Streptomyces sp. NPDC015414 TaxID=3364957 RepID=UPI0036FF0597